MFRKLTFGLLVAIALMVGFITATFAQRTPKLAALKPFLVDIQQTVPFSLTFTLPDTGESIIVPSEIDVVLSIQIKADGSVSPTVQVTESTTPLVTVSELIESGQALVDNQGIPYQIEADPEVEVIQWNVAGDYADNFSLTGELENLASETFEMFDIGIVVTLYDSDGEILEVGNGLISLSEIDSNETSPFKVMSTTPLEAVAQYLVQVEVR